MFPSRHRQPSPKMYSIDTRVTEKILHRPDREQLEESLSHYPPAAQRRIVANPRLEGLLQGFINNLLATHTDAAGAVSGGKDVPVRSPESQRPPVPVQQTQDAAPEDEEDDGPSIFGLFD